MLSKLACQRPLVAELGFNPGLTLELMLLVIVLFYLLIARILSCYQFVESLIKQLSSREQIRSQVNFILALVESFLTNF